MEKWTNPNLNLLRLIKKCRFFNIKKKLFKILDFFQTVSKTLTEVKMTERYIKMVKKLEVENFVEDCSLGHCGQEADRISITKLDFY